MADDFQWKVNFHIELKVKEALDYYRISSDGLFQFLENYTVKYCCLRRTGGFSVILLVVIQRVHLCYPIGIQRQPLPLSNGNTLLLSFSKQALLLLG